MSLTEEKAKGLRIKTGKIPLTCSGKALILEETEGMVVEEVKRITHPHPTLSENLWEAIETVKGKALHLRVSKIRCSQKKDIFKSFPLSLWKSLSSSEKNPCFKKRRKNKRYPHPGGASSSNYLGKGARRENILVSPKELEGREISLFEIERGGDVILHLPGQLVVYSILNLRDYGKDLWLYLRRLEEVILRLLENYGVKGERKKGYTGVWVEGKKITFVGVAVRNWISFHGLALNLNPDLSLFSLFHPCGLKNVRVTSLAELRRGRDFLGQGKTLSSALKRFFP